MTQQYITEEGQNFQQPMPPMPPQAPKKNAVPVTKRKWFLPVVLGAVLLVGIGIGAGDPRTVEVTKEVPVEKIVEKEVTVEVPTTPKECTDAIDYAAVIFGMNADAIGTMQDMLKHAVAMDAAGLNADSTKLDKQAAELSKVKAPYQEAVAACRAAS